MVSHEGNGEERRVTEENDRRSDSGSVHVVISMHLKEYTGNSNEFDMVDVASMKDLVRALDARFPGISDRLLDDQGNVRRYVNIFIDGEDIRERDGLLTTLRGAKEVVILPSVAGG